LHASVITAHSETGLSEAASVLAVIARAVGRDVVLEKASHPQFVEGRCAAIFLGESANGERLGFVGEFAPEVLEKFGIEMPAAGFEFTIKKGEK
jgi:phenylalanyl-tRNA synthetase beta chain